MNCKALSHTIEMINRASRLVSGRGEKFDGCGGIGEVSLHAEPESQNISKHIATQKACAINHVVYACCTNVSKKHLTGVLEKVTNRFTPFKL